VREVLGGVSKKLKVKRQKISDPFIFLLFTFAFLLRSVRQPHHTEFNETKGEQVGDADRDGEFDVRSCGRKTHFDDLFFGAGHTVLQLFEALTDA
jgi:hypothetical protein